MNATELLLNRFSLPPKLMSDQAVSAEQLDQLLTAGMTAPDHGRLQPWRFLLIEGDARQTLGDAMVDGLVLRDPAADDVAKEALRLKPLRAPTIIAVIAVKTEGNPKVPVAEQVLTAGLAGNNIILMAQAIGLGAIWLTGAPATDPHVLAHLGVGDGEELVGFVYVGHPAPDTRMPSPRRKDWRDITTRA